MRCPRPFRDAPSCIVVHGIQKAIAILVASNSLNPEPLKPKPETLNPKPVRLLRIVGHILILLEDCGPNGSQAFIFRFRFYGLGFRV